MVKDHMRDIEKEEIARLYKDVIEANKTVMDYEFVVNLLQEKELNVYMTVRDLRVALEMKQMSQE